MSCYNSSNEQPWLSLRGAEVAALSGCTGREELRPGAANALGWLYLIFVWAPGQHRRTSAFGSSCSSLRRGD